MKRKELSSNGRSKTEMGARAEDDSGFIPSAASAIQRRLVGRNSALHRGWSSDWQQPMRRGGEGKVAWGTAQPIKMLKMKEPPGMCMKTQGRKTIWPIISRAFRPKMHSFCENGRKSVGLLGRKCTGNTKVRSKRYLPGTSKRSNVISRGWNPRKRCLWRITNPRGVECIWHRIDGKDIRPLRGRKLSCCTVRIRGFHPRLMILFPSGELIKANLNAPSY